MSGLPVPSAYVIEHNRRAYSAKLCLDGATSLDYTLNQRLDCFKQALDHWPKGGFEYTEILRREQQLHAMYTMMRGPL